MVRYAAAALALLPGADIALAQEIDPAAAAASNSLTPLLIVTISVMVLTIAFLALAWILSGRRARMKEAGPREPDPDAPVKEGSPAHAAAAFAAFEKAKLVGKKVQHAAAEKEAKAGEPLSDEHPS